MTHQVTLIRGDGTGPELAEATRMVLDATGVDFDWDVQEAGIDVFENEGTPLPDRVIDSIKRTKVALKAPITTPVGTGFRSVNVALRRMFDLYACERPCKSYPGDGRADRRHRAPQRRQDPARLRHQHQADLDIRQ